MTTKTIGVVGRGSGWQKVGIEVGSYVFHPNSSQQGMFQTFTKNRNMVIPILVKVKMMKHSRYVFTMMETILVNVTTGPKGLYS